MSGVEKAPDAFRTISEVADDLDVPQHVLRFWESRFTQIKPMKRGGGRRYYRPDDVALLRGIRHLLYGQGYTIRGVQRILREQGLRFVQTVWQEGAEQPLPSEDEDQTATETAEEDVAEAEAGEALSGPMGSAGRRGPARQGERREPTFAQGGEGAPANKPASGHRAGLTPAHREALQGALADLAECRKLLDAALDETG
jgi:DNA-binding transcriptional MerR regulator